MTERIQTLSVGFPSGIVARPVQMWLPDTWETSPERNILIMHDGQNLFNEKDSFDGIWGIIPALNRLESLQAIVPTAVIGIWNAGEKRFSEYMPEIRPADDPIWDELRAEYDWEVELLSLQYTGWLVETLIPLVKRRLLPADSESRIYTMGSSMGGLISLEILTRYPGVFSGAGCLSTHWTAADDPTVDYFIPRIPDPGKAKLYFDFGTIDLDEEYEPFQNRLDSALLDKGWIFGRDFLSHRFHGADHSERSWRRRLEVPLAFLLSSTAAPA
jgi:predicted alpha/beta superfamily hydrolase